MKKKHALRFSFSAKPIRQPVTKVGGQPVWLEAPQWPISRHFKEPMLFLGQVALDPAVFGGGPGRMAYLFITEPDIFGDLTFEESAGVGFWTEPFDGENAIIIQPGGQIVNDLLEIRPLATGPGLSRFRLNRNGRSGLPVRVEFGAQLTPGVDPDYISPEETTEAQLLENKVGGTPALQYDFNYPPLAHWPLLAQLNLGKLPFDFGLDESWVMHALLAPDGTTGVITVQDTSLDFADDLLLFEQPEAEGKGGAADVTAAGDAETWAEEVPPSAPAQQPASAASAAKPDDQP